MVPPSTVSLRSIKNLLDAAGAEGLSPEPLLSASGIELPEADALDVRVRADLYHRLWRIVVERLGDPTFPLRAASQLDPTSYDVFGFSVISSATVADALRRVQRYLPVVTDAVRANFDVERGQARFSLMREDAQPEHAFADEFMLGSVVYLVRRHTGTRWSPTEVRYRHAAPADVSAQQAFYDATLRFECPCSELVLPEPSLHAPLLRADSAMATFFDRAIQASLERSHPNRTLVHSLRRALVEGLSSGDCSIETAARGLAMSARTLRRRLRGEGVSFRAVLDGVRCELAKRHLEERRLTLREIAFVLGYSQAAPFHRAFRRWTGVTPDAYRDRGLA